MKKRIISILLCLVMLMSLLPVGVMADDTTPAEKFTVTFDPNGGTGEMAAVPVEDGKYVLPECTFTAPAGKTFKCWSVDGEEKAVGAELNVSKDTSVTAVWCTSLNFSMTGYNVTDAIYDLKITPDAATASVLYGSFEHYGSRYIIFTDISSYEGIQSSMVTDDSCFAANTQYYLMIALSAAAGCSIEDLTEENVKLDGKSAEMFIPSGDYYHAIFVLDKFPSDLCTVSFSAGDGSGEMESVKVEKGSRYTLPESDFTAPDGKVFKCWSAGGEEFGSGGKFNIKEDTVFAASYCSSVVTSASYTLDESTFGTNKKIADIKVSANDNVGVVPFASEDQYGIDYFVCTSSDALVGKFTSQIYLSSESKFYGDTTYYLVVVINPQDDYSLSGLTKENVKLGEKVAAALVPYGDSAMSVAAVFALGGKAAGEICTITFDANGGSGEMAAKQVESGNNFTLPECTFTPPEGKTFSCWYSGRGRMAPGALVYKTSNDMTFQALWGTPITSADYTMSGYEYGCKISELNVSRDKNIYAGLDFDNGNYSNFYRIYKSYDAETNELSNRVVDGSSETFAAGTVYYLEVGVCSQTNYSVNDLSEENITINGTLKPIYSYHNAENNIRAVFKLEPLTESYLVSFDANGGTGEMTPVRIEKGGSYTLPECTFKAPAGKAFKCWSVDGANKEIGAKITVSADTTVTAKWGTPVNSVNFTMNGFDVGGKVTSLNVSRDPAKSTGITFSDGVYSNGYDIYKNCDEGTGNLSNRVSSDEETFAAGTVYYLRVSVRALDAYSVNGINANNITINGSNKPFKVIYHDFNNDVKAIFKLEMNTVSFDANGGEGTMASVSVANGSKYTLPECSFTAPAGKAFKCWSVDGANKEIGESITVSKDTTVKAVWAEPVGSVSFSLSGYELGKKIVNIDVTPDAASASKLYYEKTYWNGSYVIFTDASVLEGNYDSSVGKDSSDVFAVNKSYYLLVVVYAKIDYSLAGLTKENVKLDGKSADALIPYADGSLVTYAVFKLDQLTEPHVHDYSVRFVKPAALKTPGTCSAPAVYYMSCSCGDISTSKTFAADIEPNNHSFGQWVTVTPAKVNVEGLKERSCKDCGYKQAEKIPALKPSANFTDIKEGAFYYNAVQWAVANNITSGMTKTTFEPGTECTRGHVVTFLWRAAGSPEPVSTVNPFTDVKPGSFYYKAVLWAVENNITKGMSATTFDPNLICTRGQVVTFLWRYQGSPDIGSAANPFTDVSSSAFYYKAVLWAVGNNITNGMTKTTFEPLINCTRGQVVTFLYRAVNG